MNSVMDLKTISDAIEELKEMHTSDLYDFRFEIKNDILKVIGWTHTFYLENISQEKARDELKEFKDIFNSLVLFSPDLSDYISDKQIEYNLYYDTGKSSVKVYSELNGEVTYCLS